MNEIKIELVNPNTNPEHDLFEIRDVDGCIVVKFERWQLRYLYERLKKEIGKNFKKGVDNETKV